jgi:hypothetical protein
VIWEYLGKIWVFLQEMSQFLGGLGDCCGGIVGICTLITIYFVLRQTREAARQSRLVATSTISSLYEEIVSPMFDIDKVFLQYPRLKPYFYDGVDIPEGHDDYDLAMSVAEMYTDFMDLFVVLQDIASKQAEDTPIPWSDWTEYFKDVYRSSPAVRKLWSKRGYWYSSTLKNLLEPLESKFKEL